MYHLKNSISRFLLVLCLYEWNHKRKVRWPSIKKNEKSGMSNSHCLHSGQDRIFRLYVGWMLIIQMMAMIKNEWDLQVFNFKKIDYFQLWFLIDKVTYGILLRKQLLDLNTFQGKKTRYFLQFWSEKGSNWIPLWIGHVPHKLI